MVLSTLASRYPTIAMHAAASASATPEEHARIREMLSEADIICAATSSTTPLFPASALRAGAHVNLVGSYTPQMAEAGADLLARAGRVVVDSRDACAREAGELINAKVQPEEMVEIGELAHVDDGGALVVDDARCAEVKGAGDVTVFKSVGVGVQDAAIAAFVVERAQTLGVGTLIDGYNS